ncbi:hypothetical protein CPB85DRAFT_701141 [Mucidula mucida]|nr:hypothetical protein CPB85DRAFT_701141 [Mucidula mucida]
MTLQNVRDPCGQSLFACGTHSLPNERRMRGVSITVPCYLVEPSPTVCHFHSNLKRSFHAFCIRHEQDKRRGMEPQCPDFRCLYLLRRYLSILICQSPHICRGRSPKTTLPSLLARNSRQGRFPGPSSRFLRRARLGGSSGRAWWTTILEQAFPSGHQLSYALAERMEVGLKRP